MDDINFNNFSVVQLKRWLSALGMPTQGLKAELMARLRRVPPEERGQAPREDANPNSGEDQPDNEDSEEVQGDASAHQFQGAEGNVNIAPAASQRVFSRDALEQHELLAIIRQLQAEVSAHRNLLQQAQTRGAAQQQAVDNSGNLGDSNILPRSPMHASSGNPTSLIVLPTSDDNASGGGITSSNVLPALQGIASSGNSSGLAVFGSTNNNTAVFNADGAASRAASATSLSFAKEAAIDFDENMCARIWVEHLKNIGQVYVLADDCLRMLFITKLKGKAQRWLHANPTRMLEPFERLCEQLIMAFGQMSSKSEQRRKFEQRKWQQTERFAMYFEDKMMLAQPINLETDELLEQIIEGVPSANLRDQARIQRFANPEQMQQAFANICLPQIIETNAAKKTSMEASANNELRCRNCNSKGHFAKDCRKPKRAPGSCFACGEMGHFVGQCPKRKSASDNNNYNVS
ncbi:uncharacterized protein LOC123037448 [Drosophila rhopaloa]|uniref:Uncharacterized protein n=1 Tax=Drosophila rhopaloa TaxID=1041015 RepID=A0ABM5J5P5_DRORH|nr:uncharacterized protein LOC123037448 [Drosophila rhopaloa]